MNFKNIKKILVLNFALLAFGSTLALRTSAEAAVKIQQWQTPSGTEVYFVEDHDLPIVDVSVNFAAGTALDTVGKSVLAGITR